MSTANLTDRAAIVTLEDNLFAAHVALRNDPGMLADAIGHLWDVVKMEETLPNGEFNPAVLLLARQMLHVD